MTFIWIVFIIVTCLNVAVLKWRSREYVKANPELAAGYRTLIRGYLIWMNIPWLVMGIGCTVGRIPSMVYFLRPADGNPYVIAWYASVIAEWLLGSYWLFFKSGAKML